MPPRTFCMVSKIERQIVQSVEDRRQRFLGGHQVTEVGPAVAAANQAPALRIGRALILGVLAILDVEAALGGEEQAVTRGASGEDAVHHVHPHGGVFGDLVGIADSHDVAGLVGRE